MKTRYLVLEDGTVFKGEAFGSEQASIGETVFTTGMTGYQEAISNPSGFGQILVMTYPLIGNTGINRDDYESIELAINGIVVREYSDEPSNFRSTMTLGDLLTLKGIPGIQGIDTRKLTRLLREKGPLKGKLTAAGEELDVVVANREIEAYEVPVNQVGAMSTKKAYSSPGQGKRVVVIDYGLKHGLLRELNKRDFDVIVVPYNTSTEAILALVPDGILLSNGPGNPEDVEGASHTIKHLVGKAPIFGIGLGHQLLAMSYGAKIQKMKYGHSGGNYPVKDLTTGRTELTSQSHSYVLEESSIASTPLSVTHRALNDGTVEGICNDADRVFSVQFHPEASSGPHDASHLFDRFANLIYSSTRKENFYA
ncbi:carbamoyl-phosphate synthase pyrimidine-specific small chain [Sporosarcina sp. NCCP-2222]|uniref:carbamoyl phosphate synthase small subunit n=1 Tax=Sporosarcina sp. NCCP-2222 TaxID=2935073 RepID=UPI002083EE06|nr:carbamoyl phosphate synthase small subunit [Sporosarcina sp. NCCP-2222]GKV55653.1 carbamoyl-phosphate synthase pyrimidine-specific small chain [Sporosarcina sp. NCCP-2222]